MSLGKIVFQSITLGIVVGLLANALAGPGAAGIAGSATAFLAVIAAGLIQPPPKRRRRTDGD